MYCQKAREQMVELSPTRRFPITVRASMYSHGSQCHVYAWKRHFLEKISIFLFPLSD